MLFPHVATPNLVLFSLHLSKASDNEPAHQLMLELTLIPLEVLQVFILQRNQFGNLPTLDGDSYYSVGRISVVGSRFRNRSPDDDMGSLKSHVCDISSLLARALIIDMNEQISW